MCHSLLGILKMQEFQILPQRSLRVIWGISTEKIIRVLCSISDQNVVKNDCLRD